MHFRAAMRIVAGMMLVLLGTSAMVDDKLASIAATGADAVVSTDLGCLPNIG